MHFRRDGRIATPSLPNLPLEPDTPTTPTSRPAKRKRQMSLAESMMQTPTAPKTPLPLPFSAQSSSKPPIARSDYLATQEKQLNVCTKGLRPFNIFGCDGMAEYSQVNYWILHHDMTNASVITIPATTTIISSNKSELIRSMTGAFLLENDPGAESSEAVLR